MAKRKAGSLSAAARAKTEQAVEPSSETGKASQGDAGKGKASSFKRTSTGYRNADGKVLKRLAVFATEEQIKQIKRMAFDAEQSVSAFILDRLGV